MSDGTNSQPDKSRQAPRSTTGLKPHTLYRLRMLANNYRPVLTDCKRAVERGWNKQIVDEAVVLGWNRSSLASTGVHLTGDLAAFDFDIPDAALVGELSDALRKRYPELFSAGLIRGATNTVKCALFCRTDKLFRRRASLKYISPAKRDDPNGATCCIECFSARSTRQFAIDGPRSRDKSGNVVSIYKFANDASPASVPLSALPILPQKAFDFACEQFGRIARAAGFISIMRKKAEQKAAAGKYVFDLTPDMTFEDGCSAWTLAELHDEYVYQNHIGNQFRINSSFSGDGGTNDSKCVVCHSHKHNSIGVFNFEDELLHLPVTAKPDAVWRDFARQLRTMESPFKKARGA
jgi:hypothetical protein